MDNHGQHPVQDAITLGIAILGAALGIFNTGMAFLRDRVKLKVISSGVLFSTGKDPLRIEDSLRIEVMNQGFLPITISSAGFELTRSRERLLFIPRFFDSSHLPYRLEARTALTMFLPEGIEQDPRLREEKRAYITTACGLTVYESH